MIWTLAFRNIRSNVRRSIISILAIAVGLAVLIFSGTLRVGQYDTLVNSGVSQLAGHVVVQQVGFQDNKEPTYILDNGNAIRSNLMTLFPDSTVTTRIYLGGLLSSSSNPSFLTITGVDPLAEASVSDMPNKLISGEWLTNNPKDIIIGKNTAEMLKVDLNDKVVFTISANGEMNGQLFRVRGIFSTGSDEMDAFTGFIHYKAAQDLLQNPTAAHQVAVHLPDVFDTDKAVQDSQVKIQTPGVEILSWKEALPDIINMIEVDKIANLLINFVLFSIVALGIVNTMLMSVLERLNQFGVLMSIGMKIKLLVRMILYEGVILGLMGSALGIVLGIIVSYPIVEHGLDLSNRVGDGIQIGGTVNSAVLYGKYSPTLILFYAVFALVFSILSTLYPAYKLSKLNPVDAMRHQ